MNSFYISEITGNFVPLTSEESRHCVKVLRLSKGDHVQLLNGKGSSYEAIIQIADPKSCMLEILQENKHPNYRSYHLTVAIAPTKNMDRFEWFAEKAAEIGIDKIVPIICKHSERKELRNERLEKILISAMKQSGQKYLPELTRQISFKELIKEPFDGDKLIAHCEPGHKQTLKNSVTPGKNVMLLIGPEGDFDPAEIKLALENGYIPVSLGESRLRTETAGVVACQTVYLVNEK